MNFIECCEAYNSATSLIANGVKGHSVLFKQLDDFNVAYRNLAQALENSSLQDLFWEKGRKLFSEIHAKLARAPYRPCWLISELLENRDKSQIISELKMRLPNVDPSIRTYFEIVMSKIEQLRDIQVNPLCAEIANCHLTGGRIVFVLEEMQFLEEARKCLAEVVQGSDWQMARPSSLRIMQKADHVIIFASARWLKYRSEEYLLRAPIAADTHLLACRHEFGGKLELSLIDDRTSISVVGGISNIDLDLNASFGALPPRPESSFRLIYPDEKEDCQYAKKISAIPFKFGGGHGAFLSPKSAVWIAKIELIQGIPQCSSIEQIYADSLEPGDFVLMTTSGGGDMIPVVADMILGSEAQKLRETQNRWKAALRAVLDRNSTQYVVSQLQSRGAQNATPTNIRNWSSPRSIGMENLEDDLRALLQFIRMEPEYENVAYAIERLRRAHTSAGFELQRKLRASLCGKDFNGLFEKEWLEIRGDGGAAKTVFLVKERGREQEISEDWEGAIRDVEE
jgi:hypothetical protein